MDLYYSENSCALAPHIVALEAQIDIEPHRVDLTAGKTASGVDFLTINPKGYVPALVLDDGTVLTENAAILQYLADLRPDRRLAPENGSFGRVRLQEMLNYIAMEIHRGFSPLLNSGTPAQVRQERSAALRRRYTLLDRGFARQNYLLGDGLTIADVYLFVITRWADFVKFDLSDFTNVLAFQERMAGRPATEAALAAQRGDPS